MPEPQNAAERAALKVYLDSFEKEIGFRPEIHFEARTAPETAAAPELSPEPAARTGEAERAAAGENLPVIESMRAAELEATAGAAVDQAARVSGRLLPGLPTASKASFTMRPTFLPPRRS